MALRFKFSFQPDTNRFPSFVSNPKAILFLNLSQACFKNSLFLIAPLPKITFSTPASIYFLILSIVLIPPPISIFKSYLFKISLIISRFDCLTC